MSKPMDDAEFRGYVKRALEDNDKSHGIIFKKLDKIDKTTSELKVSSAKGGVLGGAITAAIAFIGLYIKHKIGRGG